ncbi:Exonuclease mut-7 [Seminavis robusta]|uniref:Exonuclease mut-7 n=1 Tax=Seminavis robusta TaxID=568900 RepID=A0A9N8EAC5_9STRA|nr:Exonuclease mut-7 [Seminavis robusta]|eukprot:Sro671_g184960.1 Exonuclease mut-7 (1306) ;mRNA; r:46554-50637
MDLLKSRLCQAVVDPRSDAVYYEFVEEAEEDRSELTTCISGEEQIRVVPVKTLIWKVQFQQNPTTTSAGTVTETAGNDLDHSFFFATALRYRDRVDEELLKERLLACSVESTTTTASEHKEAQSTTCIATKIIGASSKDKHETDTHHKTAQEANVLLQVAHLELAETSQAEALTGYMSGTIPPLGHTRPMVLLLDEALLTTTKGGSFLSIGSGSFRHAVRIQSAVLIRLAKVLNAGVYTAGFTTTNAKAATISNTLPIDESESAVQDAANALSPSADSESVVDGGDVQYLSNRLRHACLKKGSAATIQDVIAKVGDRFPQLFEPGSYSRNPIHLAAWKGDLESIRLLVNAGTQFGLDLVNSISTGDGNYGKTALFYATNQGRDDVVRFLLDHGANVLIVNRNGNTPCGMAQGKLLPSTCETLRRMEKRQLADGNVYQHYDFGVAADAEDAGAIPMAATADPGTTQEQQPQQQSSAEGTEVCMKTLSKKLRDSAAKKGRAGIVREILEVAGERFPLLVKLGTDGNFTKNALHLAAWKGDLESIELLIDAGNKHGLDLVNVISTGEGNFGKSPIFYAITQDRDDAVKLLLSRGANLLIVNNKGQTPCSMSVTHLQPETCLLMFETEHQQILAGGEFQNYRVSRGDGKQYGDLDPRFEIDAANYSVDIVAGLDNFRGTLSSILEQPIHTNQPVYKLLPKSFEPRSVRPTTKEIRQSRADRFRVNHSTCAKRLQGSKLPPAKDFLSKSVEEKKESESDKLQNEGKSKDPMPGHEEHDMALESLPRLRLNDLPTIDASGKESDTLVATLINEESLVAILSKEVSLTLELPGGNDSQDRDDRLLQRSWGLDCEWKPARDRGRENPVATLQLSSVTKSFLIDLQELCQGAVKDPETPMTQVEAVLCETLSTLFMNPNILIVGFGIGQDISKLAVSFPHMPCFRTMQSVVDMETLFHSCFPKSTHKSLKSLQKSACYLLKKRLDKAEQCSNWQERPLTNSQIEYACLDAAVLPHLLHQALARSKQTMHDGFFDNYAHLIVSWRISFLDAQHVAASVSPKAAYYIDCGTTKNLLGIWYAKQTWKTGKSDPAPPLLIPVPDQRDADTLKREKETKKQAAKQKAKAAQQVQKKKKPLKLSCISTVKGLPEAGRFLGYTKESCIVELLAQPVLDSLVDQYYLGFNRRGGIIQLQNAWLLFVNIGCSLQNQRYNNKISGNGRYMTFTVDPRKDLDGLFYDYLSVGPEQGRQTTDSTPSNKILLFARPDGNSQYLFCGQCKCVGAEARAGNIDLLLELLAFEAMETTAYKELIAKLAMQ